jgi:hypothetical protein
VSVKKKKRKHGKVRLRARRSAWSVHARRHDSPRKHNAESAPVQWLRIIPDRREDDLKVYVASGTRSLNTTPRDETEAPIPLN